jgi:hypothetical protein
MIKAVVCLALLATVNGLGQDPGNFWATLVATGGTTVNGLCHFRYDPRTYTLTTHCHHNVQSPTAAHIHMAGSADPTATGNPIVTYANNGASPLKKSDVLTPEQEQALFNGFLYVNIHTAAMAAGAARGNLKSAATAGTWVSELDNAQAVVTPATASSGVGMVTQKGSGPYTYDVMIFHDIAAQVNAAHIHGPSPAPGNSSGVLVTICSAATTACPAPGMPLMATGVNPDDAKASVYLPLAWTYFNVHTTAHAGGEIRGQVVGITALEQPLITNAAMAANFWADLAKYNGATTGAGVCHFRYNTTTMVLWYHCQHDIPAADVTAAHVHIGAVGVNGDPIVTLANAGVSPMKGMSAALTNDQEEKLFTEGLYINVHSKTFAAGQIRGQIISAVPAGTWVAEIDNGQALTNPGSANLAWGLGVVKAVGTAAPYTYDVTVYHNMKSQITAAHIHSPTTTPRSTAGASVVICSNAAGCGAVGSVIMKTGLAEIGTPYNDIRDGKSYINLHTAMYPNGELRGQVMKVTALTQPVRPKNAAASLSLGVSVFAAIILAIFALLQ